MNDSTIERLQSCLERLKAGDPAARDDLLRISYERLDRLVRQMLRKDDRLTGWEQTDDVRQNAALRLWRSLEQIKPDTVAQFLGLAATQIRRELIDLARHYFGEHGLGRRSAPLNTSGDSSAPEAAASGNTYDPNKLAAWTEFHKAVEALPPEERQLVEMLWYLGLPQEDAARQLNVDLSTVKRRWRAIRLKLHKVVQGWDARD